MLARLTGAEYFFEARLRLEEGRVDGARRGFQLLSGKEPRACGEAGAITTNDEAMAPTHEVDSRPRAGEEILPRIEGYNGRLDSIQAGMLSVKLRHLGGWNESRRELAHRYHGLFAEAKDSVIVPRESPWTRGVYHLYLCACKIAWLADTPRRSSDCTGIHIDSAASPEGVSAPRLQEG